MNPIIIIGSGHAGLNVAREVRSNSADVPLVILSKEAITAYYKPNLSKALSMGKSAEQLVMKTEDILAEELAAELISRVEVINIDPQKKVVSYRNLQGEIRQKTYQTLVLATGANPIQLPVEKFSSVPFLAVNNLDDYRVFRQTIKSKKRVLIIGAGFVGCELASDLSTQGYQVAVIDKGQWPLQRAIPEVMGSTIRKAMTETGVEWHFGKTVEAAQLSSLGCADATMVTLSDGSVIKTDVIVSAVGLRPNTRLASHAGLDTGQGIVVNEYLQTSSADIYALGDCIQYQGVPFPFIAPATQAAKALAKTITGQLTPFAMPSLAVAVKITVCPTVIFPSAKTKGVWEVQGMGMDLEAHLIDELGAISGFALMGNCIAKKTELARQCLDRKESDRHELGSNHEPHPAKLTDRGKHLSLAI